MNKLRLYYWKKKLGFKYSVHLLNTYYVLIPVIDTENKNGEQALAFMTLVLVYMCVLNVYNV